MAAPADPSSLSRFELEAELAALRGEVAELKQLVAVLREENARLKGLKARPVIKPSGMEEATTPNHPGRLGRRRGKVIPRVPVETQVLRVAVPPGSQFKGYEPYQVQDLEIHARVVRYRRERWLTPDGQTIVAPLPLGTRGHFGPELRRWVLTQYHQGQVTVERLLAQLQATGISISKREVMRLLIDQQDEFLAENREVLQAGLATADWTSVATPAHVIVASTPSARRSATTASPGLGPPAARAGRTSSSYCAPATPTMSSTTRRWSTCASTACPARWSGSWPGTTSASSLTKPPGSAIWSGSASPRLRSLPIRCALPPRARYGGRWPSMASSTRR